MASIPVKVVRQMEIWIVKKYENMQAAAVQELQDAVLSSVKENRGGLVNSFYVEDRSNKRNYKGGAVLSSCSYAKIVDQGRGPVVVKRAKSLSNYNTSFQSGHSPFGLMPWNNNVVIEADGFAGYDYVQKAKKMLLARINKL